MDCLLKKTLIFAIVLNQLLIKVFYEKVQRI